MAECSFCQAPAAALSPCGPSSGMQTSAGWQQTVMHCSAP